MISENAHRDAQIGIVISEIAVKRRGWTMRIEHVAGERACRPGTDTLLFSTGSAPRTDTE